MTLVNFVVALMVPKLTRRIGNAQLLAGGLIVYLMGMAWLSRVTFGTPCLIGVALPRVLIGAGQGMTLSPLTAAGISGVEPRDAGAASGIVNVAHQHGNSLGLAVLVAVSVIGAQGLSGTALLAHRVTLVLTSSVAILALARLLVVTLIVRPRIAARHIETVAEVAKSQ